MTPTELQEAFTRTLKETNLVNRQIKDATAPRNKQKLIRRKKRTAVPSTLAYKPVGKYGLDEIGENKCPK